MMNVKHSMMFGLVSRLVSYVDSWSQQDRKQGVAWWKHRERRQEDVKGSLLQMSHCPFQHFSEWGDGHSRCSGSCHFLSHPLTFGIVSCLLCAGKRWLRTISGIVRFSTECYCNLTHCFPRQGRTWTLTTRSWSNFAKVKRKGKKTWEQFDA